VYTRAFECRAIVMAATQPETSSREVFEDEKGLDGAGKAGNGETHTTICLRPSRGLRMNLRVRSVTGESESAILAVGWLSMLAMLPRSR